MAKYYPFEVQLARISLAVSLSLLILLVLVMWFHQTSHWLILLVVILGGLAVTWTTVTIKQKVAYQIRSQTNFLEALVRGDYSMRARQSTTEHELTPLHEVINKLAERLSQQRWQTIESQLLIEMILAHIDVAILALNEDKKLTFSNAAAQELLNNNLTSPCNELPENLADIHLVEPGQSKVLTLNINGSSRRFHVQKASFREQGQVNHLIFIANVHQLLRVEERTAWQRLIRVMSHEINNSLSPIASISQTLIKLSEQQPESQFNAQVKSSLSVVTNRAQGLKDFVHGYNQLAKLPPPKTSETNLNAVINKCSQLLALTGQVQLVDTPLSLLIDENQFEQLFINLLKNADQSAHARGVESEIEIKWHVDTTTVKLCVIDNGVGITNDENLFVPYYSTKAEGSGIGLMLCQQIVEGHGGTIELLNNAQCDGCTVVIELPIRSLIER